MSAQAYTEDSKKQKFTSMAQTREMEQSKALQNLRVSLFCLGPNLGQLLFDKLSFENVFLEIYLYCISKINWFWNCLVKETMFARYTVYTM